MSTKMCPLCKGADIECVENICAEDINKLYVDVYKVNVLRLFKEKEIEFYSCNNCGLKYFTKSVVGDGAFYESLQGMDLYYMDNKEEYDFAAGFIKQPDNVLDIGCGKGAFLKKIKCNEFTGLELSTAAMEIGEKEGVNILNETIQDHSILNKEKYDVVTAFQVLEHIDCDILLDFLKGAIDCIKKDGLLIISVPANDSFLKRMKNCTLNLPPHHQTRWPDKTLRKIAEIFELDIVKLHHDKLADRQYKEYVTVNAEYFLSTNRKKIMRSKRNIFHKAFGHLFNLVGKAPVKFVISKIHPKGHSVTIIYRKKK